jgi:uncharacterized BrkB/YihY/UPF0761 family membrane protein
VSWSALPRGRRRDSADRWRGKLLRAWRSLRHLLLFAGRVLRSFSRNRGILLAGGVAYNAPLSLVPFLTLTVATLSIFFGEARSLEMLG